jgi:hypothetical protein
MSRCWDCARFGYDIKPKFHSESSSSYGSTAQFGPWPSLLWFRKYAFYRAVLLVRRPTPILEDQASVFMTPGDRVAQLYPQALGIYFNHLLRHAWVTVGLFFNPGHHTGFIQNSWSAFLLFRFFIISFSVPSIPLLLPHCVQWMLQAQCVVFMWLLNLVLFCDNHATPYW